MSKKHYEITLRGRVQNVGFRHKALQEANKYGVKGIVMNQPDGSVYIEAEGDEEQLDKFALWCRQGPNWARVDDAVVNEGAVKNYDDFSVQYRSVY